MGENEKYHIGIIYMLLNKILVLNIFVWFVDYMLEITLILTKDEFSIIIIHNTTIATTPPPWPENIYYYYLLSYTARSKHICTLKIIILLKYT